METYKEYPIRCKTCNEQISCFSSDYESLLNSGLTIEEALNQLGIMDECSRIAMMNPTIVLFDMENREVIEGFKRVDSVMDTDISQASTSRPIFGPCLNVNMDLPLNLPTTPKIVPKITPKTPPVRTPVPIAKPGIQTPPKLAPITPPVRTTPIAPVKFQPVNLLQPIQPIKETPLTNVVPGIELTVDDIAIALNEIPVTKPFEIPTMVGFPTINPLPNVIEKTVFVGAGKYVTVLNGRTHLCR